MKHFLHPQGTVLKPGQKDDHHDLKKNSIKNETQKLSGSNVEAQPISEKGMVKVYQETSVEPVGGSSQKEA
eukprot:9070713-Prorocentrum_lima.AAC.1